jgi:hypothetical protein
MNLTRTTLRTLPAILALAATFAAAPARADWEWNTDTWARGQAVEAQLMVDGSAAPLYLSNRADMRRYFQAYAGRNYAIVVHNTTGQRLGVNIAVDGLNVVSGTRSTLSPDEQMYVLGPWETTTIRGWRTSLNDIQRFVFVDEQRSYASRTGQANADMGWIRVQSYREQRPWWQPRPRLAEDRRTRDELMGGRNEPQRSAVPEAAPVPAPAQGRAEAASPQVQSEGEAMRKQAGDALGRNDEGGSFPGTGWGEHRSDPVQRVEFTAEQRATDTLNFRYEYASGLQALGIYRHRDRLRERDNGELGFAKPPRW